MNPDLFYYQLVDGPGRVVAIARWRGGQVLLTNMDGREAWFDPQHARELAAAIVNRWPTMFYVAQTERNQAGFVLHARPYADEDVALDNPEDRS